MEAGYTIVRSRRRTLSLSVNRKLEVVVRAPLRLPQRDIDSWVAVHADWIAKQKQCMAQSQQDRRVLTEDEVADLRASAREVLPRKVAHYAAVMGVLPTAVKVTSATTRWGSCSARNSLCFAYRVMLLPEPLVDYIVVHELAHIREKNHSKRFYAVVSQYLPDYADRIRELRSWSKSNKLA